MANSNLSGHEARQRLYEAVRDDGTFEAKAESALEVGEQYLGADNGHLTRIDRETDHWLTVASTDDSDGQFPPGLELGLAKTYCRRTINSEGALALHDAPSQGWADDPAFRAHGLHCYHGTAIEVNGEPYGTVCFVAEDRREEPFTDGETMFAELVARLLERELERCYQEAELARRASLVNVLNRVLRHNLRNDMCVVRGRVQYLMESATEDVHWKVALEKIDDLLELSEKARKLELDVGHEIDRRERDLVALAGTVADRVRADYPAATITVESAEPVSAAVLPSFERVLGELVENAAKHAGQAPTVTVRLDYVPNGVEISVVDDGPGLPKCERAVLDTGVETPLVHGSGLGLWLVYWLVTSHDGQVEASVTDSGTTMRVWLPRAPETDLAGTRRLQRARDRYEAAFEEAFDGIVLLDDDARIIDANPQASGIYGLDHRELLGREITEFLPEGFDFASAWGEFQGAGHDRDRVRLMGADGADRLVEYSATADIVPGEHLVIVRELTDEAERRQAELS